MGVLYRRIFKVFRAHFSLINKENPEWPFPGTTLLFCNIQARDRKINSPEAIIALLKIGCDLRVCKAPRLPHRDSMQSIILVSSHFLIASCHPCSSPALLLALTQLEYYALGWWYRTNWNGKTIYTHRICTFVPPCSQMLVILKTAFNKIEKLLILLSLGSWIYVSMLCHKNENTWNFY